MSLSGGRFDFPVVGEFVLGHMIGSGYEMQVTARMQAISMDNGANFTSITRVAIKMSKLSACALFGFV